MLPQIVIVGRPNVGKSSILNMLAGRRVAIVDPTPGVTRDRVAVEVALPPAERNGPFRYCTVIDTGGYGVYSGDDELCVLTDDIENQISTAMLEADLVLFVVDTRSGITPLDHQVAQLLRRRLGDNTPILLVANKTDHENYEPDAMEAMKLGFGEPQMLSTTSGRGKHELIDAIAERIDFDTECQPDESQMLLAVVGKRNAGKSTLINALAGSNRVIASELPGTTRDSVDVKVKLPDERVLTAIDTAGLRKRKSVKEDVEYYSAHRALRSIRRADAVLLLIDATEPVSRVDKKLSEEILDHYKPTVIVINKWDLVEDKLKPGDYLEYLTDALRGLDFAPIVFVSALNNDQVTEAVETAFDLYEQAGKRIGTGELNRHVKDILEQRGPSSKLGHRAKVYYVTMPTVHPPTIVLFVNHEEMFTPQYRRYMLNEFRKRTPYEEVPIKLEVRPRSRRTSPDETVVEL